MEGSGKKDDEGLLPVSLETGDGRKRFTLLGPGPCGSLRLIAADVLLGHEVRIASLRPENHELPVGTALVIWTHSLPDGLYENGALVRTALHRLARKPKFAEFWLQSHPGVFAQKVGARGVQVEKGKAWLAVQDSITDQ